MSSDFQTRMRNAAKAAPPPVPPAMTQLDKDVVMGKPIATTVRKMTDEEAELVKAGISPQSRYPASERKLLMDLGLREGQPVPEGFAQKFQALLNEHRDSGIRQGLTTEQIGKIQSVEDMPPELRQRAMDLLAETTQILTSPNTQKTVTVSGYPQEVQEALLQLSAVHIPDDDPQPAHVPPPNSTESTVAESTVADRFDPFPPQEAEGTPETASFSEGESEVKRCVHCGGNPFEDVEKSPISTNDKRRYLIALGSGRSFEKEYLIFGETVKVRFRSVRAGEADLVRMWAVDKVIELLKGKPLPPSVVLDMQQRFEHRMATALQTVSVTSAVPGSDLHWQAPDGKGIGIEDWRRMYPDDIKTLDDLLEMFGHVVCSDAMMAAIADRLYVFNDLDRRLTLNANDTENFWKGI